MGAHTIEVQPRRSDWGLRGLRAKWHHFAEAIRVGRAASGYDTLILSTVGIEAFIIAAFRSLLRSARRIIVFDFLTPRDSFFVRILRFLLNRIDGFAVIRRGDVQTLHRRFGYPAERCTFIPFPSPPDLSDHSTVDAGYIYSAGWAHRDWSVLLRALEPLTYPAKLSPGKPLDVPADARHIEILPMQSPENGRALMADASVVVLAMTETDLPSGPLVLLDAMAMGKAIVCTAVNGTRDYVVDGQTALTVPAGDPAALRKAIDTLMTDRDLRITLGRAARADAVASFTVENTSDELVGFAVRIANASFQGKS